MNSQFIGVTVCDECGSRFKLSEKHRKIIGKQTRCPKCKSVFQVELVDPTPLERVAVSESSAEPSEETSPPAKKRRRSQSEIRQEQIDSIREGFRQMHPRLTSIAEAQKSSEEQVRLWVIDALSDVLGYKHSEEIDTEVRVLGQRVDIALKKDEQIFLVIECKNIRNKLRGQVTEQAVAYATSLSARWVVTTNGKIWKLFQVTPRDGQEPRVTEIFDVALLDEDGVSEIDAECLYLLTSRAVFCGDLEKKSHYIACTSRKRVLKALASERVTKALRLELAASYETEHGKKVSLKDEDVDVVLEEALGLTEL